MLYDITISNKNDGKQLTVTIGRNTLTLWVFNINTSRRREFNYQHLAHAAFFFFRKLHIRPRLLNPSIASKYHIFLFSFQTFTTRPDLKTFAQKVFYYVGGSKSFDTVHISQQPLIIAAP